MIITISGPALAGKDTTGDLLGKSLKMPVIKATLRVYSEEKGLDILEFERKYASQSEKFDRKLDKWQQKKAKEYGNNCIVVSALSGKLFEKKAGLKVWIYASLDERAKRAAKRDDKPKSQAKKYVHEREERFRKRIKRIYGYDFWDQSLYNLCIDTGKFGPEQVNKIILKALEVVK